MKVSDVTKRYIEATKRGPGFAGDFASALSDDDAKTVYDECKALGFNKLVRPLWYDYSQQCFRWQGSES